MLLLFLPSLLPQSVSSPLLRRGCSLVLNPDHLLCRHYENSPSIDFPRYPPEQTAAEHPPYSYNKQPGSHPPIVKRGGGMEGGRPSFLLSAIYSRGIRSGLEIRRAGVVKEGSRRYCKQREEIPLVLNPTGIESAVFAPLERQPEYVRVRCLLCELRV